MNTFVLTQVIDFMLKGKTLLYYTNLLSKDKNIFKWKESIEI